MLQTNLRIFLEDLLPADVHERCSNKAYVSTNWFAGWSPNDTLVVSVGHEGIVAHADICDPGIPSAKKYAIVTL